MLIQNLFKRDIARPINGVVKADQMDDATRWQELDEFVITRELDGHIRRFFESYLDAIDHRNDADVSGRIGVWVSGFFGSGKSHFIKILHYLLRNEPVTLDEQTKQPFEFLSSKIDDSMFVGDLKRAVATDTDVILFNIDSKAGHKAGRDAILQVFLKVLNEMQGYSPDHPHIAHMERYLEAKGKLGEFKEAFEKATGSPWAQERDAYEFNRDEVIEAFCTATGQSKESAEKWIDNGENTFELTVENFSKWVKEYLDSKGPDHRLIFVVDEVGQFIGGDTHLMLNLQTITEQLGTACRGRAWVVVTSQEDIDAVLGEMKTSKANDFSKIQGRFRTRLSLSSANVDEVIQERLLAKDADAVPELEQLFTEKGDIINNQLTFRNVGMTLRNYKGPEDFVRNYPFAPYQFLLLQKVFESIRKAGATGLHLSRGERSILDAFQSAAKQVRHDEVGVLVPLHRFYPAIESFLDTAVKRTIDQAAERDLDTFDIDLLKVLFLIRYVDEIRGNVDNLVTLSLDQIDQDRLSLRRKIEESLVRLEKETLISRSGDVYSFLTNEERDISREIKNVELVGGEEAKLLGEIIFDDVLKGMRKHRFSANKVDFTLNRSVDGHPFGNRSEGGLSVQVISPLSEEYEYFGDERCKLDSTSEGGSVILRLPDHESLGRELRTYLKTAKYVRSKDADDESTRRIIRHFGEENQVRRGRLVSLLGEMLAEGDCYAAGTKLATKASAPQAILDEAVEYLVKNTFNKMGLLKNLHDDPVKEIQAVLRANDIGQMQLALKAEDNNSQALEDVKSYVELCSKTSRQIVLYEMIENRYGVRPYGWPSLETALLVAQLMVLGEIGLMMEGATLPVDRSYEPLATTSKWRKIVILKKQTSDPKAIQQARMLGNEVFSEMGPDGEEPLYLFLQRHLRGWQTDLASWKSLADTGSYPGGQEIADGLNTIKPLLGEEDSYKFIEKFNANKDALLDLSDAYHDLDHFFNHQKQTWERLRKAHERFDRNRLDLERDEKAAAGLRRMREILDAPAPYPLLKEAAGLISTVEQVNQTLVADRRSDALEKVEKQATAIRQELESVKADDSLRSRCLTPVESLVQQVKQTESLAHMAQAVSESQRLFDAAVRSISEWIEQQQAKGDETTPPPPAVKPIQVVKPTELLSQNYIETEEDIDAFLNQLRTALKAAVSENKRVQIR